MKKIVHSISTKRPKAILPPTIALRKVTSKSGLGVYASTDTLFRGAIFGRDSIEVAEDLMMIRPKLVKRIILTLASLQGEIINNANEEEPGKILHEYRSKVIDGKHITGVTKEIFSELSNKWGGDGKTLVYYGSIDSTPHFVRMLATYIESYGEEILHETVTLKSGRNRTIREVINSSLEWIIGKLNNSRSGLLEFKKKNHDGIDNQVWKDSKEFYVHENKHFVNHHYPIASIEVQGLVYDALIKSAALNLEFSKARNLTSLAHQIRDRTLELLWLNDREYFGLGIDYNERGKLRVIATKTSNPAELLDTCIFDELPASKRKHYISSIVKTIMSTDFLTDGGIRSRALSAADLVAFWDYHGSFTTWPKETYDIAKGLRRHGMNSLARQLENRLLNVALSSNSYPEFIFVDEWGRVLTKKPKVHDHGDVVVVDSNNTPESIQAWTVSAILAIVSGRIDSKTRHHEHVKPENWQASLDKEIMLNIPKVERLTSSLTLAARYPAYDYRLTRKSGNNHRNI